MSYITKAMLEEDNRRLRRVLQVQADEITSLRKLVKALELPGNVLNTMSITVQRVALTMENLVQSIPAVERYARSKEVMPK